MDATGKIPPYSTPRQPASERQNQEQGRAFDRLVAVAQPPPVPPRYEAVPGEQPPSYTPFVEGAVRCVPMTNPSLENCLTRLQNAYHVDFDSLAGRIDFDVGGILHDSIRITTFKFIRECRESLDMKLRALAKRLEKLYPSTEADLSERVDKNKLAFIVTIFLLEQKAQLVGAATSSGAKPLPPASVLRDFFHMLQADIDFTSSPIICKAAKAFLDEHPDLRDQLEGHGSAAQVPNYSDLCFDDIPGAMASAELRKQIQEFSQQYGIDFTCFIEAMGEGKARQHTSVRDPVQKAMTAIGMKGGSRQLTLNTSDSYLDHNAKLVITAMNYFQGKVFCGGNPPPIPRVKGEKCPSEQVPVQESSATDQKMAEVAKQFTAFFFSICSRVNRKDIFRQVKEHINERWPNGLQALQPGKF